MCVLLRTRSPTIVLQGAGTGSGAEGGFQSLTAAYRRALARLREGSAIFAGDRIVGMTTSGTMGPFVQKAIAMGLVERGVLSEGDECTVDVRGRKLRAKVVPLPFYKRSTK